MNITRSPPALVVHLKRFKVDPQTYASQKLFYRIPFPEELSMNIEGQAPQKYHLKGFVVHAGAGIQFGHYYSLVKSNGKWINFNDTRVSIVEDQETHRYYGQPPMDNKGSHPCAFMLLYEAESILNDMQH